LLRKDNHNSENLSDDEIRRRILRPFIPSIIKKLIEMEIIDINIKYSQQELWKIAAENVEMFDPIYNTEIFYHDFIDFARRAFDEGKFLVGLVLLATSIEQITNIIYREFLGVSNVYGDEATNIIRRLSNDDKLGWFYRVLVGIDLPDDLIAKIRSLNEIRNSIVHYKAKPFNLDGEGFHDLIKKRVEQIGYKNLLSIPDELINAFNSGLIDLDENYKYAEELANSMFEENEIIDE